MEYKNLCYVYFCTTCFNNSLTNPCYTCVSKHNDFIKEVNDNPVNKSNIELLRES